MDISRFRVNAPGKLLPIEGKDHAFVPYPLPDGWGIADALWPLLAEANKQIGILEGLGRTLPNPGILLRPLEDRESIKSSELEGTYATPRELLLFEIDQPEPTSAADRANDWLEVYNYRKALQHGTTSDLPLSLRLIRELHRILLMGVRGADRTPGEFRRIQVAIGESRRFVPPPPTELMNCLDPFERYLNDDPGTDPLISCFLAHYQFETIHPFLDGNGRVGRLLLAIMLQRKCELSKPWLFLSEFFENSRDEYIGLLFDVSAKGNWNEWLAYCLRGTIAQAKSAVNRCDRLRLLKDDFGRRIAAIGGSTRLNQIADGLFHSPFVTVVDLAATLDVTYPTANADASKLVEAGILEAMNRSPKTFYSPEVFEIAYENMDDGAPFGA